MLSRDQKARFKKTFDTGNAPAPICHTSMTLLASSQNSQKRIERWYWGQPPESQISASNCRHGFTSRRKLQWILGSAAVTFQPLHIEGRGKKKVRESRHNSHPRRLCLVFLSHVYILSGMLLLRGLTKIFEIDI